MRRAAKVDGNHAAVINALRAAGSTVVDASAMGKGFPDLVVGRGGITFLLEVKAPETLRKDGAPKALFGTDAATAERQAKFRETWRGGVIRVVRTPIEALTAVGVFDR